MSTPESTLKARALDLKLHGLLSHWEAIKDNSWVNDLIQWKRRNGAAQPGASPQGRPPGALQAPGRLRLGLAGPL